MRCVRAGRPRWTGRHFGLRFPEVYKLVRLAVHLARCLYAECGGELRHPSARKHMISVLASDTVRPNAAHTTTITPIIFLNCSGDCETTRHRQRKAYPKAASRGLTLRQLLPPIPPAPLFFLRCTKVSMMPLSALKRVEAKFITAAKKMLNRRGASTHP